MDWRIQQLQLAIQALAQPANIQISLFPNFVVVTDELALNFYFSHTTVMSIQNNGLEPEQIKMLSALDALLQKMSDDKEGNHWTLEALQNDSMWDEVRDLAKQTLVELHWPDAVPPINPEERGAVYVKASEWDGKFE